MSKTVLPTQSMGAMMLDRIDFLQPGDCRQQRFVMGIKKDSRLHQFAGNDS